MKIKSGTTRTVFLFKNFVIKFPIISGYGFKYFLMGMLANINEWNWSRYGIEKLAKVKFCSPLGLFLIMERAQPVSEVDYNEFKDIPLDPSPENFGKIGDRVVCVDYGENIMSIICPKCNLFWDETHAGEYLSKSGFCSSVKNHENEVKN